MKNINFKKMLLMVLKLSALGVLIGALGGLIGGCFSHLLALVTNIRQGASWLILLLPLGGVATASLYHVFRMGSYGGTNEIIHRLEDHGSIRVITAPLIFISTLLTHLFGGSAGREGAAIQLGGATASAVSDVLRLKETERTVFLMSGMGAVFAGVFGTPLTAAVFVLEFSLAPKIILSAILPCFISGVMAQKVSSLMGVAPEAFPLSSTPAFTYGTIAKIIVLSIALSLMGKIMCICFHGAERWAKRLLPNSLLRSVIGAAVIIALTIMVGDMRYSGSGMDMALGAVKGNAHWFDFILKLTFTAITLAAGFKGGEIVPTFCIGATFGCILGSVLGMDVGLAAALGLIGLFCCAANSPIAAVFLGIELFGFKALPYFLLVCLILWPLSVKKGLFDNRFFKPISFRKRKRNF